MSGMWIVMGKSIDVISTTFSSPIISDSQLPSALTDLYVVFLAFFFGACHEGRKEARWVYWVVANGHLVSLIYRDLPNLYVAHLTFFGFIMALVSLSIVFQLEAVLVVAIVDVVVVFLVGFLVDIREVVLLMVLITFLGLLLIFANSQHPLVDLDRPVLPRIPFLRRRPSSRRPRPPLSSSLSPKPHLQ